MKFVINSIAMLKTLTSVTILICALNGLTAQQEFSIQMRTAIDGYYSEAHDVTTNDGYILEVQRIPFRRFQITENDSKTPKPVVFLMHGLQASSLSFIYLGPGRALAYLLAEAGYDVWMGNARGGLNSRRHVTLDPDEDAKDFFDYSYEDIALNDVSDMIDYILKITGQEQLHYIAHSQGGTAFLVMNSMRTEYNQKIKSAHLMAGVGYMEHFPNRLLHALAFSTNIIYSLAVDQGILEVLGPRNLDNFDEEAYIINPVLSLLKTLLDVIVSIHKLVESLAPASMKQYAHFGQNIRAKSFRRFSYDPLRNLIKYGSLSAPEYDISKITVNTTMHYTINDNLLDERDVLSMAKVIPNAKARKIARETYNHHDFVLAPDSKELVYDYILEELNKNL